MIVRSGAALGALFLIASVSNAQPAPAGTAASTAAILPVAPAGVAVLRTGTEVPLRLSEQLTTKGKQLRVGQRFHMETAEAVVVNGVTVIPVGSPAMGEITDVRNKGMWGKSGHLGARILYVEANGRQIRLSGSFDDKGVTGTAGVVAAIAFVPVVGFFTTGTSAEVASGASVKGFVDEDVPLSFADTTPVPMTVAVPTQQPALATAPAIAAPSQSQPVAATPTTATLTPAVLTKH